MKEQIEKYLPVGTVVLLKGAVKRLMITGFCVKTPENENKIYDYCGCVYPEGFISSDKTCVFDHNQIQKIFHFGFSDEEDKTFRSKLNEMVKNESGSNEVL